MTLMGDPSLRMRYVAPPADLVATNADWFVHFTWSPSPAEVDGYHIYRIDDAAGTIVRITPEPVQGTTFTSGTIPFIPGDRYMVRALQLVTTPSGSYYDLSLGALAVAEGEQIADCEGVLGGPAIPGTPCDDGNAQTFGETYDTLCACVTAPIGIGESDPDGALVLRPTVTDGVLHVSAVRSGAFVIRAMDGSAVARGRIANGDQRIAVDAFPAGSYVLEFRQGGDGISLTRRFVVQH